MTATRQGPPDEAPRTKTDAAYHVLRRAIVTGDIGPNEPLDESSLMQRYEIGRTPLREALKILAREQFVTWLAHSTPIVRGLSGDDLANLYQTRLILEEPASRLSAVRITEAELDSLEELSLQMEEYVAAGDIYQAAEADHAVHLAIARSSGNWFLDEAVSNLNCGSLRLWFIALERLEDHAPSREGQLDLTRHGHVLDALRSRDPDRAAAEMRAHILRSHQRQLVLQAQSVATFMPTTTGLPTGAWAGNS